MANKVANVDDVTEAMGGVVLADRTTPLAPSRPPAVRSMHDMSARVVRSHLQRMPEAVHVATPDNVMPTEAPLTATDTAPGFAALRQIPVGRGGITDLCVDTASGRICAVNQVDNSVSVIDPETLSVSATAAELDEPFAIAAFAGRAYVSTATPSYDALTVLDTVHSEPRVHPLALSVRSIAVSPDGTRVFAARSGRRGADVAVVDIADGAVTTVDLDTRPDATAEAIKVSRNGSRVYVATADHIGGEVVVINPATGLVVGGAAFDTAPRDLEISADGTTVFVASFDATLGGVVHLVDTTSMRLVDTIVLGGAPTQLLLSAADERLYVLNGDCVTVLCTRTHEVIDTITVVAGPSCMAGSADGKLLFIADYAGGITALTVASSTASLLARMLGSTDAAILEVPMPELEAAAG